MKLRNRRGGRSAIPQQSHPRLQPLFFGSLTQPYQHVCVASAATDGAQCYRRATKMRREFQIVLLSLAFCGACSSAAGPPQFCGCPPVLVGSTVLQLPCGTADRPVVTILEGQCAVGDSATEKTVELLSGAAGICRVELTFAGGTHSSVEVDFTTGPWQPCGTDPHGCGRSTLAVQPVVPIGDQCTDAGLDSGG